MNNPVELEPLTNYDGNVSSKTICVIPVKEQNDQFSRNHFIVSSYIRTYENSTKSFITYLVQSKCLEFYGDRDILDDIIFTCGIRPISLSCFKDAVEIDKNKRIPKKYRLLFFVLCAVMIIIGFILRYSSWATCVKPGIYWKCNPAAACGISLLVFGFLFGNSACWSLIDFNKLQTKLAPYSAEGLLFDNNKQMIHKVHFNINHGGTITRFTDDLQVLHEPFVKITSTETICVFDKLTSVSHDDGSNVVFKYWINDQSIEFEYDIYTEKLKDCYSEITTWCEQHIKQDIKIKTML